MMNDDEIPRAVVCRKQLVPSGTFMGSSFINLGLFCLLLPSFSIQVG